MRRIAASQAQQLAGCACCIQQRWQRGLQLPWAGSCECRMRCSHQTAADGRQAAVPSPNRFDQLSDMTDMDTDAATMAAQLAATTTAAHGSGGGSGSAC